MGIDNIIESIVTVFFNKKTLKINANVGVVTKIINTGLMKSLKSDYLIHANFLTRININLTYCCEKLFILMNKWMIRKN